MIKKTYNVYNDLQHLQHLQHSTTVGAVVAMLLL